MMCSCVVIVGLVFLPQTFTVGHQLLALYVLPAAEDSVFVIIPKRGARGMVCFGSSLQCCCQPELWHLAERYDVRCFCVLVLMFCEQQNIGDVANLYTVLTVAVRTHSIRDSSLNLTAYVDSFFLGSS